MRFLVEIILVRIRGYAAYPLGYRNPEVMMQGRSWWMDKAYINVKGAWKYLYRAVDKVGKTTIDFLLAVRRDKAATKRFFEKAIGLSGESEKVTLDKSGANKVAIDGINNGHEIPIYVRQIKYLNNIVEKDHRSIKRLTHPMLNFKSFRSTAAVLAGIELMSTMRKG